MSFLQTILPIFAQTLLPVFLVAGAGALLAARLPLDGRTLGRIIFYLATPSLVFRSLYDMQIDYGALQRIALVAAAVAVATGLLGWLAGYDQPRAVAPPLCSPARCRIMAIWDCPSAYSPLAKRDWC